MTRPAVRAPRAVGHRRSAIVFAALAGAVAAPLLSAALRDAPDGTFGSALFGFAPCVAAEGGASNLVAEARRKVRQHDVTGAVKLLEQAIAADPANADAHMLYQDVSRQAVGLGPLAAEYKKRLSAAPQDPLVAFLAARLLPPEEALADYDKQTQKFPGSAWGYAGKARALEDLGRHADALAAHDLAIERAGPDAPRFLAYRAYGFERAGKFEAAIEAWKAVIAKAPADASARYGLGDALRIAGLHDEALVVLEEARKSASGDPEPPYRIALVHMDAGKWDEAVRAFEGALAADRGMLEALCGASEAVIHRARATAAAEKRDLAEKDLEPAVAWADKAVVAAPESAYAHFALGAAYEARGEINFDNYELALKEYDAALERLPIPGAPKVRALVARSYCLLRLGRWEEAADAAQKALDIDKSNAVAYGNGGHALAAQGKPQDAVTRFYKPGLKACPDDARLLHDYGVALREMKKPNDAKKPLEDARRLEPKNGTYRLTLGELYYELGRYKEAVAELFEATELLPRDPLAWRCYARACYAGKHWEEAATSYEKVIELAPDSVDEHLYCAVIYADQMKNKAKAKPHVEAFLKKGGSDPNLKDWLEQILADQPKGP